MEEKIICENCGGNMNFNVVSKVYVCQRCGMIVEASYEEMYERTSLAREL